MYLEEIQEVIEEQIAVSFTGKIIVLNKKNKQQIGFMVIHEGDVVRVEYIKASGLKAFYSFFIDIFDKKPIDIIVEPEVIDNFQRNIHYPYSVLKAKVGSVLSRYSASVKTRPPENLKLLVRGDFITEGDEVTSNEYDVLLTLSDYNRVKDVYENCLLLDFEITDALVSLRKKNAIKVIKPSIQSH